jgi:hypothetical protein
LRSGKRCDAPGGTAARVRSSGLRTAGWRCSRRSRAALRRPLGSWSRASGLVAHEERSLEPDVAMRLGDNWAAMSQEKREDRARGVGSPGARRDRGFLAFYDPRIAFLTVVGLWGQRVACTSKK